MFRGVLVKATRAGLNSFFSALNKAHSFSNARKTFGKKAASKPQTKEFFLCFVVKFFNSTVSQDCFSQLKKLLTTVFIHDLDEFFVAFEKFARAYLFQIALEII